MLGAHWIYPVRIVGARGRAPRVLERGTLRFATRLNLAATQQEVRFRGYPLAPINDRANRFKVRFDLASFAKINVAMSSASDRQFIFELPNFALGGADKFGAELLMQRVTQRFDTTAIEIFERSGRFLEAGGDIWARLVAPREPELLRFARLDKI